MNKLINSIPNKLLAIGTVMAVVIIALFSLDYYQKSRQVDGLSDSELLKVSKENIVDYQVMDFDAGQPGDIIKYQYVSNKEVPPQTYNGLKEDLSKRTNNSISFLESVKPINDKFQKEKYVSQFFSSQTWQKSGNKWYQIETVTTTKTAFLSQTKLTALDHVKEFFGQKALADTFYAGAGDGYVYKANNANWTTTHDASTGQGVDYGGSISSVETGTHGFTTNIDIYRSFLPFNTSAISSDAVISAVTLNIFIISATGGVSDYINVVTTTQSSPTILTTSDYSLSGITVGASNLNLSGMATGVYQTLNFNATGLTWIIKSGQTAFSGATAGISYLGLKEGHDITDSNNGSLYTGLVFSTSEETAGAGGTGQDPRLDVTYTVIAPAKVVIDGGTIKIDGGTLKID